jgi:co-chaperonin GroES (HSP10)
MAQTKSDYIEVKSVPQPIRDNIMVKRGKVESDTTDGGIILVDSSRRLDNSGTVVGLGDYARRTKKGTKIPFQVELEDRVYFEWHSAQKKLKVGDDFYD